MDTRQRTVLVYPVVYPNFFTQVTPPTWAIPGSYVYIYTGRYTDWVQTMVTTISYLLWHLHGSLTCPFAGGVTAGIHNEGIDIFIPLR